MKNIIEVKNLTKNYKNLRAIDDLSFEVKDGEILGLLGPNGSGKSTTINCILSLLKFQKGSIKIFDKVMRPNSYDIKEKIGVIFQEVAVFEEQQENEVYGDRDHHEHTRLFPVVFVLFDEEAEDVCVEDGDEHDDDVKRLPPTIKEHADDKQHHVAPLDVRHDVIQRQRDRQIREEKNQ